MGQVLTVLLGSAAPALALLAYAVAKSRCGWRNPALWTAVISGGMAQLAARIGDNVVARVAQQRMLAVPGTGRAAAAAMGFAAVEEAVKFLALVQIAEPRARRPQDVIAFAIAVGSGFAVLENTAYLYGTSDIALALGRAGTAAPAHCAYAIIMGALLLRARLSARLDHLVAALLVPVLVHAAYDFPALLLLQGGVADFFAVGAWFCAEVAAAGVAVRLVNANFARDRALEAMRERGTDPGTGAPLRLILGGLTLAATAPGLVAARAALGEGVAALAAAPVIPLWLGIDLARDGWRKRANPRRPRTAEDARPD